MTTTVVLASANDGFVATGTATWNDALNGFSPTAVNGSVELLYGTDQSGLGYVAYQAFVEFAYTRPASNHVECGVAIGVRHTQIHQSSSCSLFAISYDWGGAVDAGDFRNPLDALFSHTRHVRIYDPQASGTSQYIWGGSDELTAAVRAGGTSNYRYMITTDRALTYDLAPGVDEFLGFWSAESSVDPTMVVSSQPRSTLYEVLGAQVQLSDGTWAVLESDGAAASTILLRHVDTAGTATTKATIPVNGDGSTFVCGSAAFSTGSQQFALVVDSADNLFVIGRRSTTTNDIACKAYVKGSGYTWTAQTTTSGGLPASTTDPTNFAAAWHTTGSGTIVLLVSRNTSDGIRTSSSEMCYAILSAGVALAGSGTLIRSSGFAVGVFTPTVSSDAFITQANDTGTGLDVVALSATKGVVHTWSRRSRLGTDQPTCRARYILNSAGAGFDNVFYDINETSAGTWGVKSCAGKLRALPVDSDTCAVVSADSDLTWGLTVAVLRNSGTTTAWTLLGRVRLSNEALATMPSTSSLAETQAWDAVEVAGPGKIWVYYFDVASAQRLMRTAVSLATYTATREEVQVSAAVGAAGSTNLAIRVQRGTVTPRRVLITIANRTAGGALSTIYLVDTPNEAPTAPALATRSNFDAGSAATFNWTFQDPDIGDTQTSFEVDINTSVGVDVYDTGQLSGLILYRAIGALAQADNASLTPALPAGWQPGDLLVIPAYIRTGAGTVNTPAGWTALLTSGNLKVLGRIARTGDVAPTISFAGGVAGDTTLARCFALYGTEQNIASVVDTSTAQANVSAQNMAVPGIVATNDDVTQIIVGVKDDDWTSVATLAGQVFTEIADSPSTLGNDAGLEIQVRTGSFAGAKTVTATTLTVTGGASATSRVAVLAIKPHRTATAASFTLPAGILTNGVAYQWRVRTWDQASAAGAWSAYSTFSTGTGGTVDVVDPAIDNPANVITSYYPVGWTLTGAVQVDYRVEVYRTDTSALVYTSGWVTSAATTQVVTGLLSDIEQRIQVTTRTAGLVESNTGTRLITPSYAAPDEAAVTVTSVTGDGYTLVATNNPTPAGSRPAAAYNVVQRRAVTGDDQGQDWVTIGATDPNGQWLDYTAASNVTYEYRIVTVAADGNEQVSATVENTLCLQGVWIHDPVNPADVTAAHFVYGGQGKGDELEATAESLSYAGRALPVFEFGEHETEVVDVPIQVPFGADWNAQIADLFAIPRLRTTLCIRDARGRRIFGVVTKVTRSDEKWGTDVEFQVDRVDYDETYLGPP